YRHFERIVNLTLHGAVFAAVNSGLWFLQGMRHPWPQLGRLTLAWTALLLIHASVVVLLRPRTTIAAAAEAPTPSDAPNQP
ncbi:MAG: hypothetical protein ACK5JJ_00720, partial [Cyanobacteriota bacterium]